MKSARERAEALAESIGFLSGGLAWKAFVDEAQRSFTEHARDQRHLCAESVNAVEPAQRNVPQGPNVVAVRWDAHATIDRAHAAVMNTPAPGEGAR